MCSVDISGGSIVSCCSSLLMLFVLDFVWMFWICVCMVEIVIFCWVVMLFGWVLVERVFSILVLVGVRL